MADNPFEALAAAYFDGVTHIRQRPNTRLYEWLNQHVAERQIRGPIVRRSLWCDLWHAEVPRIKQAVGIPVLDLDLDDADAPARTVGRVAAFLEMFD